MLPTDHVTDVTDYKCGKSWMFTLMPIGFKSGQHNRAGVELKKTNKKKKNGTSKQHHHNWVSEHPYMLFFKSPSNSYWDTKLWGIKWSGLPYRERDSVNILGMATSLKTNKIRTRLITNRKFKSLFLKWSEDWFLQAVSHMHILISKFCGLYG